MRTAPDSSTFGRSLVSKKKPGLAYWGSFKALGRLPPLKPNTKKVEANNQEGDDNPCQSKGEHIAHIMSRDA